MMQHKDRSGDPASLSPWRTLARRVAAQRDLQKRSSLPYKPGDIVEQAEKQSDVL
jgi:hypothetical protein